MVLAEPQTARVTKLGEILRIKHGYAFKGQYFATEGSHIVLTPGNFFDAGGFKPKGDKEKFYDGPVPEDFILARGDIIIAMTEQAEGLLGSSAIVPLDDIYLHNQRLGLIENVDKDRAFEKFLYYLFNWRLVRQQIRASASGTKVRHTSPSRIYEVKVSLPSVASQKKIAAILSAYDDLIENNLRRIRILEEMAQALYREWFVEFRFPGHEGVRMVESEIGEIPEGWTIRTVGEVLADHIGGGWGKEQPTGRYELPAHVIRGTDIPGAAYLQTEDCPLRFHTESNLRSRRLRPGDVVLEVSGGGKTQSTGRSLLVTEQLLKSFDEDVICASFCKRLQVDPDKIAPEIFLLHLKEIYDSRKITLYEVQSTGIKNLKFANFLNREQLLLPSQEAQEGFLNHVVPLLDMIQNLSARNEILRKTRDLLLPRLISGTLDVSTLDIPLPETTP